MQVTIPLTEPTVGVAVPLIVIYVPVAGAEATIPAVKSPSNPAEATAFVATVAAALTTVGSPATTL